MVEVEVVGQEKRWGYPEESSSRYLAEGREKRSVYVWNRTW